jgi:hypothetical protein
MNLVDMLSELREEARRIDDAIIAIERLLRAGGKRRGRPPKWLSAAPAPDQPAKTVRPA